VLLCFSSSPRATTRPLRSLLPTPDTLLLKHDCGTSRALSCHPRRPVILSLHACVLELRLPVSSRTTPRRFERRPLVECMTYMRLTSWAYITGARLSRTDRRSRLERSREDREGVVWEDADEVQVGMWKTWGRPRGSGRAPLGDVSGERDVERGEAMGTREGRDPTCP
jgi:hypothetical protein